MPTSQSRTTTQAWQRMGVSNVQSTMTKVCEQHGDYEAHEYKWGVSPCPQCWEVKIEAEHKERAKQDEIERVQRRIQYLFDRAAIPPRFADRSLDTFDATLPGQKKALEVAKNYAATFDEADGTSMIFCGGVGAGKTHLAVGIARELIERQRMAIFMSVMGAIRTVKDTYRRGSEVTETEAIENLIKPDLLILDEVGVQFGSDTEKLILFEVLNGRYENRRSTILISNLAMDKLSDYLGERVVDRLREGGGKMVVFDWPSYRRQAA